MIECRHCGATYPPNTLFCYRCGNALPSAQPRSGGPGKAPTTAPIARAVPEPDGAPDGSPDGSEDPWADEHTSPQGVSEAEARGIAATSPLSAAVTLPIQLELATLDGSRVLRPTLRGQLMIGRGDPDSSIRPELDVSELGDEAIGVSRRHAIIIRNGPTLVLQDLESRNGTYVNQRRVSREQFFLLKPGDVIRLGDLSLRIDWKPER
jgi:hypothetical protein